MKIACLGGGPAGLYFAILMKKADPRHDVVVVERNPPDVTFGWGVVFSDETLGNLLEADPESQRAITASFAHWDAIDVRLRGEVVTSRGHGFSGIARKRLLSILQARARELGVRLELGREAESAAPWAEYDLVVAADGVNSKLRRERAAVFEPSLDVRPNRYVWLGTKKKFDAFTFIFEETPHGLFWVHAYRFDAGTSTFIVECAPGTWKEAGLDRASEAESVAFLEKLFARHLGGEKLLVNKSAWINFVTVRNARWHDGNVVLMGDAAHTAHFSIGSGTKLAMEDAIALRDAFQHTSDVPGALARYEEERRPIVERTQKAAQDSLSWFENVPRYWKMPPLQLSLSLLTRSKRVSWDNLRVRDAAFVEHVRDWFDGEASAPPGTPPMFTPFAIRGVTLENRVGVSPMSMYSADDGTVGDFYLVHYGSRAMGGAGLVFTEMTDVSRDGRITPGCAGLYRPEHVPAWRRVVDFVHAHSKAKLCCQIAHAGRKGSTRRMWEGIDEPLAEGNWPLLSASPLPYLPHSQVPKEMDRADMERVTADFVRAAKMAGEAGFDLLELHMAHGYLIASFLSPLTNLRKDAWGGPLENRLRWPLEVFDAVRAAWPKEKPLGVRLSATDWIEGGLTGEESVLIARALAGHGCDWIDVSAGQTTPEAHPRFYGRMFQTPFADQIRNETGLATMAVGNISSADQCNTIVASGRADLVLLARQHLSDPCFTLHAAAEQGYEAPWPVQYERARPRR